MPNTYTQPFRVRFDECGPDGTARSATILRYAAETAFAHSAAVGFPLSWYLTHGLFWLVRDARVDLAVPVEHAATLEVTTQVVGVRRVWARRVNAVRVAAGGRVGTVTMDWILTDTNGRPVRIPPSMLAAFPIPPGDLHRIQEEATPIPPIGALTGRHRVFAHECDPRGHMNNAVYLDLFDDALAALGIDPQARPVSYTLEYLRSARSGETVEYAAWNTEAGARLVAQIPDGPVVWRAHRRSTACPPCPR